ncbi:MAG: galactokinase [Woeseiaceae bacterium]
MGQMQPVSRVIKSERIARATARNGRLFRSPGRANIIGEHTDYNDGLVLPTNTALYTWLTISPRIDRLVTVTAENFAEKEKFNLDEIAPVQQPTWIDYLKGVAAEIQATGVRLQGADISIDGEIPIGGGLSSSASVEIAMALAMLGIAEATMDRKELARACQRAEQSYGGVNCGIMDQLSVACCKRGHAMLLDCRTLATESVTIPEEITLLLTNSGVRHKLTESGYNKRADECREAVEILRGEDSSISALRDVTLEALDVHATKLGGILLRRCRHVVSENQRVRDAVYALQSADIVAVGALVQRSHASLRDDYDVSCDEIESLVDIADACDGVLGSRMMGGGFGGCVLSVVRTACLPTVTREIAAKYSDVCGAAPWMHAVSAAVPAEEVSVK